MIMIGKKAKVRLPNSYLYGKNTRGKNFEGVITKINKKTYEVTVWHSDGFSCVRIKKERINLI